MDEQCRLYKRPDPESLEHIISGCGVPLSELLGRSELTIEHKIKLAYAVARAFWEFYQSDLMKARWTSQDILFIPLSQDYSKEESREEGIPLRAFASFPFGPRYNESPDEYYEKDQYTHRYPRILYLGIVLLEIGLGQALGLENNRKLSPVAHTNTAHSKAKMKVKELKDASWDGFQWKDYFVEAVENCLDSANFKPIPKRRKSRRRGHSEDGDAISRSSPRSARRDALYQKVVAPLRWLATKGFGDSDDEDQAEVPLVPLRKKLRRALTVTESDDSEGFWSEIRTRASFLSGGSSSPGGFLDDLQVIAGHITRCRRKAKITKSIRVAILDTRCRCDLPFFQNSQRSTRIKGWKDFAKGSTNKADAFGHGTFMTRLLMHVAPIVDIYLVRVAENTDELEHNEDNIAEV